MRRALLALLLVAGCQGRPTSAATAEDAIRAANLYRSEHYPRAHRGSIVTAEDRGDRWLVSYVRREGGTGGLSWFEVEKSSARILREGGGQ